MSELPDLGPLPDEQFGDWLGRITQVIDPADYATALLGQDRPYIGQPQTDEGERGRTLVVGLSMRDLKDCFVVGAFQASGLPPDEYPPTLYGLPWNDMDPIAVVQNMLCNVEKRMGIYPNVPLLEYVGPDFEP